MRLDLSVEHQRQFYYGIYERATSQVLRALIDGGDFFIDAGANVGYFTLMMARLVGAGGRVVAVEADPGNVERLRANLQLNGYDCVRIVDRALGDGFGNVDLVVGEHQVGSTLETADRAIARLGPEYVGAQKKTLQVEMTTLDHLCASELQAWPGVRVLKMDIEGAEPLALKGARQSLGLLDAVVIEQNPFMLAVHGHAHCAVAQTLTEAAFEVYAIGEGWMRPRLVRIDSEDARSGNLFAVRPGSVAQKRVGRYLG